MRAKPGQTANSKSGNRVSVAALQPGHRADGDIDLVIDAQDERARAFHAPLHVGNAERGGGLILPHGGTDLYRHHHLMAVTVYLERAMDLHFRNALLGHRALPRSGRKTIRGKRALSRTSPCIFLSRAALPLWPLMASTTSSPLARPVAGSKPMRPLASWKGPWTVWSKAPRVNSTVVRAGSIWSVLS